MFDDLFGEEEVKPKKQIQEDDNFDDILGEIVDEFFVDPEKSSGSWLPKKSVYKENRYNGNKRSKKRKKR